MYVYDNQLIDDNKKTRGTFSSHWATVAALIRLSNPDFVSLGGYKEEDLMVEKNLRKGI